MVCEAVYSELAAYFTSPARLDHFLDQLGIKREASVAQTLYRASQAWKAYRQAGGPSERILTDFLIGAHAELQASQFLSRDRHFYRRYFPRLRVPVL